MVNAQFTGAPMMLKLALSGITDPLPHVKTLVACLVAHIRNQEACGQRGMNILRLQQIFAESDVQALMRPWRYSKMLPSRVPLPHQTKETNMVNTIVLLQSSPP